MQYTIMISNFRNIMMYNFTLKYENIYKIDNVNKNNL